MTKSPSSPKVFAREATGLVRELSTFHIVGINWSSYTTYTGLMAFLSFTFLFPGGNITLGLLLTVICFLPLGITSAMSVAAMPRSGADYVFVSRVLHPALGFMLVLAYNVWFAFYSGFFINWAFTFGFSPMLSLIGTILDSPDLTNASVIVTEPNVVFVAGATVIILVAAIAIVSRKWTARLNTVLAGGGILSLAAVMVVLLTSSNQTFQSAFNEFSLKYQPNPDYYHTIIQTAQSGGLSSGAFGPDTLSLLPLGAFIFLYIVTYQGVGGEMKNPNRTTYLALAISTVTVGLVTILTGVAYSGTVTTDFGNAANFVYYGGQYALPVAPTLNVMASLLTRNILVLVVLNIGLALTNIAMLFNFFMYTPRYFLAAAFDRILPERFSDVSERFHTPHVSIIASMVLALATLLVYTYFGSMIVSLSPVIGEIAFGYLLFGIASILFPYAKGTKDIYRISSIKKSFAGVPVITILGIFNTIVLAYITYRMFVDSAYGTNGFYTLAAVVLVAAAGPIWYYIRRAYLKTRGVDLDKVFAQIPPE